MRRIKFINDVNNKFKERFEILNEFVIDKLKGIKIKNTINELKNFLNIFRF